MLDTMTVDLLAGAVTFRAAGSKVKFPGFMKIYVEGNDDGTTEKISSFLLWRPGMRLRRSLWSLSSILRSLRRAIRRRV